MIGFHGCDVKVRKLLVDRPNEVKISSEANDWLGHGFYVWENNQERALKWAEAKKFRKGSSGDFEPSVVGVVYQLGYCLDFTDNQFLSMIPKYFDLLKQELEDIGEVIPSNADHPNDAHKDRVLRGRDCAVIEFMHKKVEEAISTAKLLGKPSELRSFETVRGIFTEGGPLFEGAGIQAKNHIQVCIRNLNCIKGFFIPRKSTPFR